MEILKEILPSKQDLRGSVINVWFYRSNIGVINAEKEEEMKCILLKSYTASWKGVTGEDTENVKNLNYKIKGAVETTHKMTIYFLTGKKATALGENCYLTCS